MSLKEYWFPWYPGRFQADTMHLTALQDGIYRRLIDHYMTTKTALPDNDAALARIAGVSVEEFGENSGILRGFFKPAAGGRLVHKKCDAILKDQAKISKSYATRGALGGKAKAKKTSENQGVLNLEDSNSQATAKQQLKPNLPHDTTGQDITKQDRKGDNSESKPINKNSLTPSSPGRAETSFSIEKFLKDEDRSAVREVAPGWDIYYLFREFDSRVNSGTFTRPDKPVGAFINWAKKFTKEKPPT